MQEKEQDEWAVEGAALDEMPARNAEARDRQAVGEEG